MKRKKLIYPVTAVISVLFLYIFSYATSPLYAMYDEYDASIFMLIGKGISRGMSLYADLFDHKGPVLFFINALGYAIIPSKAGVFLVQCVFFFFTNLLVYKIAGLLLKEWQAFICMLFVLCILFSTFGGGNLSEEYCLPFCLLSVYLALKYLLTRKSAGETHPYIYAFIYGICFAVCAFIRINNGVVICAVVLALALSMIFEGRYVQLLANAIFLILGIVFVSLPIVLYFLNKGTLEDMIYAAFIYNFKYAGKGVSKDALSYLTYFLRILPEILFLAVLFFFRKIMHRDINMLIFLIIIITSLVMVMGFGYPHYYTTLIPNVVLLCTISTYWMSIIKSRVFTVALSAALIMSFTAYWQLDREFLSVTAKHYAERNYSQGNECALEMAKAIPSDERNSVFGYGVSAQWFLSTNIMPCYKYFTLQEWWAKSDYEILDEINQYLGTSPPKWIVVDDLDGVENIEFKEMLDNEYVYINGYDTVMLFKHR